MGWPTRLVCAFLVSAVFRVQASADPEEKKPAPVARVVSLSPSITETLFALGAGDRVVGVTRFCDYPPEAKEKPKVGGIIDPSLEAIVARKPDLVVAQKSQRLGARLRELGIATLEIENADIRQLIYSYHSVGAAIGAADQARKLARELESKLALIQKATAKTRSVKVLMVVGKQPLYVAGGRTFINELLSIAGGKNIFSDSHAPYPQVSLEEVIARSPEVIIEMTTMAGGKKDEKPSGKLGWERWSVLPAVASGRVYRVKEDSFLRPGPRLPEALVKLTCLLHPELTEKLRRGDPAGSGKNVSSPNGKQDERTPDSS